MRDFVSALAGRWLTVAALIAVWAGSASAGTFADVNDFGTNPGRLRMILYIPDGLQPGAPTVVALHGCSQEASDFVHETGWRQLADRARFLLVMPEQRPANNALRCFRWFLPEHSSRDRGEALSIREMAAWASRTHATDLARVFVFGFSAGGAMALAMLATYPDVFAGGASVGGVPYRCASSLAEASACMASGRDLRSGVWGNQVRRASNHSGAWPRVQVWQGGADTVVHSRNAGEIVEQWLSVHDLSENPGAEERGGGVAKQLYRKAGTTVLELYMVSRLGHAVPIAAGEGCGTRRPFAVEAGVCASRKAAQFWGIAGVD